ncbi:MAG: PAS domain S-box protein [Clostridia bacterium]|nr:PAS domain S-box protein [Clostridia bacterium]
MSDTIQDLNISIQQQILNAVPALIFAKDTENRFISVNTAYEEVTGLKLKEIIGKNVFDIIPNQQLAEEYYKDDLEVIETGLPKRNIIEPLLTDETKWFITDKIPFRDEKGKIKGVIGFSVDITERKNAEVALVHSERKFRMLFDTSPEAIVISDLKGRFVSVNRAFTKLLGYSFDQAIRLSFRDITPDWLMDSEMDYYRHNYFHSKPAINIEKAYIAKSGNMVPVCINYWLIYDEAGAPFRLGAFVKDLSLIKKAEQLETSLFELETERLKNELDSQSQLLNTKMAQLVEKNSLIDSLMTQLEKLKSLSPANMGERIDEIIMEMSESRNEKEEIWSQFEATFGSINSSFHENVAKAFPSLTNNERRLVAFFKMNLSTKEISGITHQTVRSIEMARSRLRKKLNIDRHTSLSSFFSQF